jgi:hypothetical protein
MLQHKSNALVGMQIHWSSTNKSHEEYENNLLHHTRIACKVIFIYEICNQMNMYVTEFCIMSCLCI